MKILLAVDGSDYSKAAAAFLKTLNLSQDDEISILHVISWVPFKDDRESHYAGLQQIKQEIAPRILDETINLLTPVKARISTALIEGEPAQTIIDVAAILNVDIIVMGSRGLRGIKSLIIGSVTRSVSLNSPKPVLAIKYPHWDESGRLRILFPTDGSAYSDMTGSFLAYMPIHNESEITILNVIWSALSDTPESLALEINDRIKDTIAKARSLEYAESEKIINQSMEYLGKKFKNIKSLSKVGDPAIEILNTAETLNTDIIAVGCRGLRGIKGMIGSVSRNILNHSKCSVLIGKTCKE